LPSQDWSAFYNTPIPPERAAEYAQWRKALPRNLDNWHDYDLQGAFLNGSDPDPKKHMTDQFKKPNHPTFSKESQYDGVSGYVGGRWDNENKTYHPSVTNLQFRPQPELQQYFKDNEKEYKLKQSDPAPLPTGPGTYRISDFTPLQAAPASAVPVSNYAQQPQQ
jgi:hypothetical protein